MYHSFRVDGLNIGNPQNCGGVTSGHTWWFPLDLALTPPTPNINNINWVTQAASNSFFQAIFNGAIIGQQLKHGSMGFGNNYLCMVYDGLKDQAFINSVFSAGNSAVFVPYDIVQYTSINGHFGGIYSASSTCCDGSVIVPGTFGGTPNTGIGIDPIDILHADIPPIITYGGNVSVDPGISTGIATSRPAHPCPPADPNALFYRNSAEFCLMCQPGGWYSAWGGWGNGMSIEHPHCKCCAQPGPGNPLG